MEYEACRISELVHHAAHEDAKAQALLIEEIRSYLRCVVDRYGAAREVNPDFAREVLSRARRDYGAFWDGHLEFGRWMDAILQREVEAVCRSA